ncbi:unnamed protein product [Coffea canephora]|uniref:Uncharacterized protein n=1 Tax=Coffea canephora TaxID=49390 RepID=A0A068UU58_COFCA|nr:unnamed protein product [Coffea canephora]
MEKASKKLILFAFFVIASLVIGGPIAKVEASRVQPAETEAEAIGRCPFPCVTNVQCLTRLCGKTRCEYSIFLRRKRCV